MSSTRGISSERAKLKHKNEKAPKAHMDKPLSLILEPIANKKYPGAFIALCFVFCVRV